MMRSEVHFIEPEYPESDLNVVLLRFRSGVIGKVVTAFGAARPQDHSVRVYGDKKSIENNLLFDKAGRYSVIARPFINNQTIKENSSFKNSVRCFVRNFVPVTLSRCLEVLLSLYRTRNAPYSVSSYPMRLYEHNYAVNASISDFVKAIRLGQKPKCGLIESAKTVATCLAGVEAYRTQKFVPVKKYWIRKFDE